MPMSPHRDLPASSPFRRNGIDVSYRTQPEYPEPLYVVPLGTRIALCSPDDVLVILAHDEAQDLVGVVQEAMSSSRGMDGAHTDNCRSDSAGSEANGTTQGTAKNRTQRKQSRWQPVLLEEQRLLADLKRVSKQAREIIADFRSGALTADDEITYAMHLNYSILLNYAPYTVGNLAAARSRKSR